MKEGFLTAQEYEIHYVKWGEKGPKILLLHSMGMDGHSMDKLAENLEDKYQILSLTLLGHGDSDEPEKPITLREHAEILRNCYKQQEFTPNTLIGHSVGGMLGMILTAEHSQEHEGLLLVDIAPFEHTGKSSQPNPPEHFNTERQAREWLKTRYPGFTNYYMENRIKYAFNQVDEKYVLKPRGDTIRSGLATDLWPYIEKIKAPTLLLKGEESDLVTPETSERMIKTIPSLNVIVIKGTGHMIPQNKPEDFEKHTRNFLEKIHYPFY